MTIEPIGEKYRAAVNEILKREWDCPPEISCKSTHDTTTLPGFVYVADETVLGAVTYYIGGGECQVVTLNSFCEQAGIGTALLQAVQKVAHKQGCRRLWLITSNDNIDALKFYQKRGFDFAAIHLNAVDEARKQKPSIPLTGRYGLPIKHEIEFEMILS